jgi:hypothetical protein
MSRDCGHFERGKQIHFLISKALCGKVFLFVAALLIAWITVSFFRLNGLYDRNAFFVNFIPG